MSTHTRIDAADARCFLLTDFGDHDSYVGVMKAVMLGIAPSLTIVDLCHAIEPQDVISAGYVLLTAVPYLPGGSVVVAVVDPGVGTQRRILALAFDSWILLAPDNGLASMVLDRFECRAAWEIIWQRWRSSAPSATFHGRDIFAPCAALLASGQRTLEQVGEKIDPATVVRIETNPTRTADGIAATMLHVDRFGNLITNVEAARWGITAGSWLCRISDDLLPVLRTFGDVPPGQPLAYIGSSGFVEIAIRNGSAAARYGKNAPLLLVPVKE